MGRPRQPVGITRNPRTGKREYRARIYDRAGKLHQYWLGTTRRPVALRGYREKELLHAKRDLETASLSIADMQKRYLTERRPHWAPTTYQGAEYALQRLIPWLSSRGIDTEYALRSADLRGYPAHLMPRYAPGTINTLLDGAKTFLRYFDIEVQARHLRKVLVPLRTLRILTPVEITTLLAAADPTFRVMIVTMLATGLCRAELLDLHWCQVDFKAGIIAADSGIKRRRTRYIPLHPALRAILESHPRTSPFVFPAPDGGKRKPGRFGKDFKIIVKRSGIPYCTSHDLRRTFLSAILAAGFPGEVAQELAGHADPRITRTYYLQVRAEAMREAVAKLPLPLDA